MVTLLSYPIRSGDPNFPGNPEFSYKSFGSIEEGDACNTCVMTLFDHFGTHFDAPNHFNPNGPKIAEMPFSRFFFDRPFLIDLKKEPDGKVVPDDFRPYREQIAEADLLMIRTGWSEVRRNDPDLYSCHSPSVSTAAAEYLMENFAKTLKAVALDFISLASPGDPEDGNESHRTMLGRYNPGEYINIIEDCNLKNVENGRIKRVWAVPLLVVGPDSSPVTMFAEDFD